MKTAAPTKRPPPIELQTIQQLCQQGAWSVAETKAHVLLKDYPNSFELYNLLAFCQQNQGKLKAAVSNLQNMLRLQPRIAEIHLNLANIQAQLGDSKDAIKSYQIALQHKPELVVAHFNLAALLQTRGQLEDATNHYQQAVTLQPNYLEALVNLGALRQQQGQLQQAELCYRQALALRPDASGYYNLGTVLYAQGRHQEALAAFNQTIKLDKQFADAWCSMGEVWRDQGDMAQAVRCYRQALSVQATHDRTKYNMGEYLALADKLEEASSYFNDCDFADSKERALQCLYKTRQFEQFQRQFQLLTSGCKKTSVLLAALAEHYATNFQIKNDYPFCQNPLVFVQHTQIEELTEPNSALLKALLDDIQHLAIAERKQGRLYYGIQSAGNLLLRSEQSFQTLANIIRAKIVAFRQHFADANNELIRAFPKTIEFTSSWYLKMSQGGYLTSHIHEEGWLSGCIYLKMPQVTVDHAGSFCYGTDGDDYPRLHDNFPSQIADVKVGDLVLFPSSLFHRTIPFQSNEERICVAFDLKPD